MTPETAAQLLGMVIVVVANLAIGAILARWISDYRDWRRLRRIWPKR